MLLPTRLDGRVGIFYHILVASSNNTLYNKLRQFYILFNIWLWMGECIMPRSTEVTRWRANGSYVLTLASKTSLIEETRLFLLTYARLGDSETTRHSLLLIVHCWDHLML